MGFMSNWEDDALLGDKLYQQKIADLIVKSLEKYRLELQLKMICIKTYKYILRITELR